LRDIAKMKNEALFSVNRYAGQRHRNRRMTGDWGARVGAALLGWVAGTLVFSDLFWARFHLVELSTLQIGLSIASSMIVSVTAFVIKKTERRT
jgi:tetrahydromethanopterin S-methyltransferase subunit E